MSEQKTGIMGRLGYRLMRTAPVRKIRRWYKHRSSSDQRAINVLAVFFLGLVLYFAAWQPVRANLKAAESYYSSRQDLYAFVKSREPEIRALQSSAGSDARGLGGEPLLSVVTDTARSRNLTLRRYEPKGENGVSLWLDAVAFNDVVTWLDELRDLYAIRVSQISVDRDQERAGTVTIKVALGV